MQWEGRAILPAPAHLAPDSDDLLNPGRGIIGDVSVVLGAVGLRHQDLDVLAHELVSGIPEQPLGGRIDRLDQAEVVDGDDGSDGGFEDPSEFGGLHRSRGRLAGLLRHGGAPKTMPFFLSHATTAPPALRQTTPLQKSSTRRSFLTSSPA